MEAVAGMGPSLPALAILEALAKRLKDAACIPETAIAIAPFISRPPLRDRRMSHGDCFGVKPQGKEDDRGKRAFL